MSTPDEGDTRRFPQDYPTEVVPNTDPGRHEYARPEDTGPQVSQYPPDEMSKIDPDRTSADDIGALRDRIAQLEKEAEARDLAARRAKSLEEQGLATGGEPVEHFHQLADGRFVRSFGLATHIVDGDKVPMPVVASYAIPDRYDDDHGHLRREE